MEHASIGRRVLERDLDAAATWIDRIYDRTRDDDVSYLLQLSKAILACLRRGLPERAVAELSKQLPPTLRGMLFDGWHPGEARIEYRDAAHFIGFVRPHVAGFHADDVLEEDVLAAARALFDLWPCAAEAARAYLPADLHEDLMLTH